MQIARRVKSPSLRRNEARERIGEKTWSQGWAEKQCTLYGVHKREEILTLRRRSSGTKEEDSDAQFSFECPGTATVL
ncbi:hypothetical protein thsrh120_35430 [Rhizobium sp. No.120]